MKAFSVALLLVFGLIIAASGQPATNAPAGATAAPPATNAPPVPGLPASASVPAPAASLPPVPPTPAVDPNGALLIAACKQSDINQAADLLQKGAPVNARGDDNVTPLILAAMRSPQMVKLLLVHGADPELRENLGYSALGCACIKGQTECGRELLDAGANVDALNNRGHTPLMDAIQKGDDDLVKALIDHHADVNKRSDWGSAIWWAVARDRLAEVTMLVNAGADFIWPPTNETPAPEAASMTLLSFAARGKDISLIDLLLAHGAKINETGSNGATPLLEALRYSDPAMVQHLLDKGADVTLADVTGETPFMHAVTDQNEPIWQALLQRGASINAKNNAGQTALIEACQIVYFPSVRFLVDHGADVNAADIHGDTAFVFAGNRGNQEIMAFLKAHGAKNTELHIVPKDMPSTPLSPSRRWALAVSAIYSQWNGVNPNKLGGEEYRDKAQRTLLRDWGIRDHAALVDTVYNLRLVGSRTKLRSQGARLAALPNWLFWLMTFRNLPASNETRAVRQNYLTWQGRSGLAGDLCRAANMVNVGYAAHYIEEDEAWRLLMLIAHDTQDRFTSWHEMCDNFLDAREMWTGTSDPALDACGDLLCNSKDPNSPWNQIPWHADLSTPNF